MMSEDQSAPVTTAADAPKQAAGGSASATRKKAPARAGSATRRTRAQGSSRASVGLSAALASQARLQNPQGDDPFQSGQRIWPD
jgi:hypothetical protein